jgi:uncharacterized protein YgiM (DUF1202 family)
VIAVAWLGAILQGRIVSSVAVVVTPEAVVRYGPFDEAQSFYTARDGTELVVLDRKGGWFQVADASKRTGWLTAKNIFVLPRS